MRSSQICANHESDDWPGPESLAPQSGPARCFKSELNLRNCLDSVMNIPFKVRLPHNDVRRSSLLLFEKFHAHLLLYHFVEIPSNRTTVRCPVKVACAPRLMSHPVDQPSLGICITKTSLQHQGCTISSVALWG